MELFHIHCLTCHAKLAVRNASLIGQILACPRCASMVHITPPPDGANSTPVDANKGSLQRTSSPPSTPLATNSIAASDGTPAATGREFLKGADAAMKTAPTVQLPNGDFSNFLALDEAPHSPSKIVETNHACEPAVDEGATLAEDSFIRWLAWGAVGAAVGAVTVGALMMRRGNQPDFLPQTDNVSVSPPAREVEASRQPQPVLAQQNAVQKEPAQEEPVPEEPVNAELIHEEPVHAEPVHAEAIHEKLVVSDAQDANPHGASANATPERIGSPSELETPPDADASTRAPVANALSERPVNPSPSTPDARILTIDPLDLDPEGLDMAGLRRGPQVPANRTPANDADGAVDATPSLSDSGAPESESPPPLPQPPNGAFDESLLNGPSLAKVPVVLDPGGSPAGAPPDIADRFAQPLAGIAIDKMPLSKFLAFATRLSGAPISAEPLELRLAGVALDHKISVRSEEETTVAKMMSSALSPLRLAVEPTMSQAIIRRQGLASEREIVYPVGDLLHGEFSSADLIAWIQKFVAPESWASAEGVSIAGEKESLRVVHQERVQYETLFFLERLRVARGLPTKSRFPVALLPVAAPESAAQSKMGSPTSFMFSQYTPLYEVFSFWQQELGMTVLVDWPSLQEAGLWPQSRIACRAGGESWSTALDDILTPLGLAWCAVDERAVQISSLSQLQRDPVVAFYQLDAAEPGDVESWQGRIDAWAAQTHSETAPGVATTIDVSSGLLIVRHAAPVHRRLAAAVK